MWSGFGMKVDTFKRTYAIMLYPILDLDKPNVSFSNILSTLVDFVHYFDIASTFSGLCPPFQIYVQISEYMSTFQSTYRHFQVHVHIYENMSIL